MMNILKALFGFIVGASALTVTGAFGLFLVTSIDPLYVHQQPAQDLLGVQIIVVIITLASLVISVWGFLGAFDHIELNDEDIANDQLRSSSGSAVVA